MARMTRLNAEATAFFSLAGSLGSPIHPFEVFSEPGECMDLWEPLTVWEQIRLSWAQVSRDFPNFVNVAGKIRRMRTLVFFVFFFSKQEVLKPFCF